MPLQESLYITDAPHTAGAAWQGSHGCESETKCQQVRHLQSQRSRLAGTLLSQGVGVSVEYFAFLSNSPQLPVVTDAWVPFSDLRIDHRVKAKFLLRPPHKPPATHRNLVSAL